MMLGVFPAGSPLFLTDEEAGPSMTAKDANILVALLANVTDATCRRVVAAPSLYSGKHRSDVSLSCFRVNVVYIHYLSSVLLRH